MSPWKRLTREPALILGVLIAALGVLVLFGVNLTQEQIGGIVTLAGAVVALLRFLTTPAAEVVAQQKPGDVIVAGPAAEPLAAGGIPAGTPVGLVQDPTA